MSIMQRTRKPPTDYFNFAADLALHKDGDRVAAEMKAAGQEAIKAQTDIEAGLVTQQFRDLAERRYGDLIERHNHIKAARSRLADKMLRPDERSETDAILRRQRARGIEEAGLRTQSQDLERSISLIEQNVQVCEKGLAERGGGFEAARQREQLQGEKERWKRELQRTRDELNETQSEHKKLLDGRAADNARFETLRGELLEELLTQ